MDRPRAALRFWTGGAAEHSLIAAGFVAAFLYLAWGFALGPIDIPMTTYSRSRWFFDLGNTANGWTGIVICLGLAGLCGRWLVRAAWRLVVRRPAIELEGAALLFHPSYRVGKIPLDEVATVRVREVAPARLFGLTPPIHALELTLKPQDRFHSPRKIKIMSNTIEGDLPALRDMEHIICCHRRQ